MSSATFEHVTFSDGLNKMSVAEVREDHSLQSSLDALANSNAGVATATDSSLKGVLTILFEPGKVYAQTQADVDPTQTQSGKVDAKASTCFEIDANHLPHMPDQPRSIVDSAPACQQRCASVSGCAHFSFWSDGGCHLQGSDAHSVSVSGVVAGPPTCAKAGPTAVLLDSDDDYNPSSGHQQLAWYQTSLELGQCAKTRDCALSVDDVSRATAAEKYVCVHGACLPSSCPRQIR